MIFFGGFLVLWLAVSMVSGQTTATARPDLKTGLEACGTGGMTCIGIPAGCAGKNESSCDVLAKVGVMGPFVHIDLSIWPQRGQKLALAGRWIAVGFSESGEMRNSPVVHCFEEGGKAQPKLTYNNNNYVKDNKGWKDIDSNRLSSSPAIHHYPPSSVCHSGRPSVISSCQPSLHPVLRFPVELFVTWANHPSLRLANRWPTRRPLFHPANRRSITPPNHPPHRPAGCPSIWLIRHSVWWPVAPSFHLANPLRPSVCHPSRPSVIPPNHPPHRPAGCTSIWLIRHSVWWPVAPSGRSVWWPAVSEILHDLPSRSLILRRPANRRAAGSCTFGSDLRISPSR